MVEVKIEIEGGKEGVGCFFFRFPEAKRPIDDERVLRGAAVITKLPR